VSEFSPGNVARTGSPLARYQARATRNTVFDQTAAYWNVSGSNGIVLGANSRVERLQSTIVTGGFLRLLGASPLLGRTFTLAEERPESAKVFLAGYAIWRDLMGADPAAIGKTFRLDGEPATLIGVLPAGFDFPGGSSVWLPVGTLSQRSLTDRISHQFWMLGRLRPGVSLSNAQAQLDALQRQSALDYPATDASWRVSVRPLLDEFVGGVRTSMWVLFGAVGFVLLIVCSNVTSLLLARATARQKEFAVRAALGAGRFRLLRQSLAEALLIGIAGAGLALLFAEGAVIGLAAFSAGSIPRFQEPHIGVTVVAFVGGLALLTALIVGLAPGLHASAESLRTGRGTSDTRHSSRLRDALVVSQVGLTLLLLSGAGLMLRSFQQLRRVDPGFRATGLTSLRLTLPDAGYTKQSQRVGFLHQLLQNLNRTPGIEIAAAIDRLPLSGEDNWSRINIAGRPLLDATSAPSVEARSVSPNYFQTLQIPLLRGRQLSDEDVMAQRRVALINREMADRFWPGGDPIGQRIVSAYHPENAIEVIGVVDNVRDASLDALPRAAMYSPYTWWNSVNIIVRGADTAAIVSSVRREVEKLDPEVPVYGIGPLSDLLRQSVSRQRFELFLLAIFALIALLVAAVGVYGLLTHAVTRRTGEIGIRVALGGQPNSVMRLLIGQGMKRIAFGLAIGLLASLGLTRLMSNLLYGVSPSDPVTLTSVIVLLAVVAWVACWIPARRALTIGPATALRCE
jgi:putative ABC transport system permease protein